MPITSYDDALAAAEEADAQAKYLRQMGMEQPQGRMVGRRYVAPHWSQQLAPIVNQLMGQYQTGRAADYRNQARQLTQEDADKWISAAPRAQTVEGPKPEDQVGPSPSVREEPSQAAKMAWAQAGMKNPLTKALAAQYGLDVTINEPKRIEERTFKDEQTRLATKEKNEEAERRRIEKGEQLAAERVEKVERQKEAERAAAERQADRNTTLLAIASSANATRESIATAGNASREGIAERRLAANRAKMNSKAVAELDQGDALNDNITEALGRLGKVKEDAVETFGRGLASEIPFGGSTISNIGRDDKIKDARDLALRISGGIQHGLFGSALSKYEKAYAGQYLATPYDSPVELKRKLKGLQEYMLLNNRRLKLMESGGVAYEEAARAYPSSAPPEPGSAPPTVPGARVIDFSELPKGR